MCIEHIEHWSWEELFNYFVTAAMNQQLGTWDDQWNPTALLGDIHLECIIGCDSARAVSDNPMEMLETYFVSSITLIQLEASTK